ncbi:alpha/beta hydrolase [Rhodopila globiformis]|uniref:Alpha/beta hydrolase n=1 Tax=Rhodopila globiformis TaxID=1071 RepID=A0A2S6NKJ3_RHOGL|nr:alpha/beta hydrolase [Rhodopila globiformis]
MFFIPLLVAAGLAGGGLWLYTPDEPRSVLVAEYAQPPSVFLTVAGIRLHVRDTGPRTAPAIIMLHGLGSSLHTWDAWAARLSHHYRVIRYDLPGFGLTGPDPTGDYSEARGLQVLGALMDSLGVRHASLIGNSMGGELAWEFAAAHPDRVDKLVLISPEGFASPMFAYNKPPDVPWVAKLLPYTLPTALLRMGLEPAYGDPSRLSDDVVRRYRDMILAPGVREALLARAAQVRLQPPEPMLRRIRAPTLLVWGEKDALIPYRNAGDYLAVMPNWRLLVFGDLGHVPMEEAPARSLAPVAMFLAQ